jgi:YVTN family beta-propeller protein
MNKVSKILVNISVTMAFLITINSSGYCTEIPQPIADFIKQTYPNASIRFDGLVELPDGTQYLPVIPINLAKVENPTLIIKIIPSKSTFATKPDLILFANNYSLLKIIKRTGEPPTLISSNETPLTIKLGILPQDLVVPENLVVPYDLKIITGDLKIPVKEDEEDSSSQNNSKSALKNIKNLNKPEKQVAQELKGLTNKVFYVSNFRSNIINAVNPQTGRSEKIIELSSIPYNITLTDDGRYILASCMSSDKISIIDTYNTTYVRDVAVGTFPTSISIVPNINIAYVANRDSSTISVLNLRTMEVIRNISVTGMPANLIISEDNNALYYNDFATGKIYAVDLNDIDRVDQITQGNNISKIVQHGDYLFILNRADNNLTVFNLTENKLAKTINIDNKPIDFKLLPNQNKLIVLSVGSINIINTETLDLTKTIQLKTGSFPSGINFIPKTNRALISYQDSYEVGIFDLEQEIITGTLPIAIPVSSMVITEVRK